MCDPVSAGIALTVMAGGTAYQMNQSHEAQNTAERRARDEQNRVQAAQDAKAGNIAKVREAYGVGDSATAQANQRSLADTIDQYYKTYLGDSLKQVDQQYGNASRTSRQNLARVGQLGSSLDTSNQSGNLADYLRGRQKAVVAAAGAKDNLVNSLTSQRLNLEGQINGGTVANPDLAAVAAAQKSAIGSAQSQLPANALGSLFNTAGSTYFTGKTQEAQGNQGLQAFGFSNSSNRGKIT